MVETLNGHKKGRAAPDIPLHTFRDSGVVVKLHKLSPMTSQEIILQVQREMADSKPQPPMAEVDYGKGKILEPNLGHPIYARLIEEWEQAVNQEANRRLFRLAALDACELTIDDAIRSQIAWKKRMLKVAAKVEWEDDPDLTAEENDQLFYIRHIACASPEDLQEFYKAITQRSQPTEAAIEAHKESFPSDI